MKSRIETFMGYDRPDGRAGARNHLAVIPSVACANGVVGAIAREVPGAVPFLHGHGCGRAGCDLVNHFRTISNLGGNPNIGAVIVVGLGCEVVKGDALAAAIAQTGKPVELVDIQAGGGSQKSARKGAALARKMMEALAAQRRVEVGPERLVVGLECGGSDAFSGVTANPAVGLVSDRVVEAGGTVIMTENTEMIGTSHILERRARTPEVAERINAMIREAEKRTRDVLGPLASMVIAPGNMDGGVSSIQEKSLGCITKGGASTIAGVVEYAEVPADRGLVLMDAPGYDVESMAGLAAAGSQVMLFTTGRGNPIGFPGVPVIKIASTGRLYSLMEDDMDFSAGVVLEGGSIEEAADGLVALLARVLSGERTKAEKNGQDGIVCLYVSGPSF